MIRYVHDFLAALVCTLISEAVILTLLFRRQGLSWIEVVRNVLPVVLLVNMMTLPYVWFVGPYVIVGEFWKSLLVSEILVLFIETLSYLYLLKISFKRAMTYSLLANAASLLLGYVMVGPGR